MSKKDKIIEELLELLDSWDQLAELCEIKHGCCVCGSSSDHLMENHGYQDMGEYRAWRLRDAKLNIKLKHNL